MEGEGEGEEEEEEEENDEEDDEEEDEDEEDNGKRYEFRQRKAIVRYQAPLDGWFYSSITKDQHI